MSDIYRCENCLFSVEAKPNFPEQKEFGNLHCRRYPPQPVWDGEIGFARSALVPVNHNWWCGEWRPKATVAKAKPDDPKVAWWPLNLIGRI